MKYKLLLLVPVVALVSACGSIMNPVGEDSFSCPGMPQGVTCKTPAAVYKSSNGDVAQTDYDTPYGKAANDKSNVALPTMTPGMGGDSYNVTGGSSVPRPIREPALIMRIWIAPWVDKNDNWNSGSYQYAEITKRKWNFGKTETAGGGVVVPWRDVSAKPTTTMLDAPSRPNTQKSGSSAMNGVAKGNFEMSNMMPGAGANPGAFDVNAGVNAVSSAAGSALPSIGK